MSLRRRVSGSSARSGSPTSFPSPQPDRPRLGRSRRAAVVYHAARGRREPAAAVRSGGSSSRWATRCGIARTVAEALAHAHARGVVHRDIKPENLLLFGGEPMVADFGIALALDRAGEDRLTQTGYSLGTPVYMSPEQACAAPQIDGRTDIYSLGCVLYEMLAGEPPFTGPTPQAILAKTAEPSRAPSLRTVRDGPGGPGPGRPDGPGPESRGPVPDGAMNSPGRSPRGPLGPRPPRRRRQRTLRRPASRRRFRRRWRGLLLLRALARSRCGWRLDETSAAHRRRTRLAVLPFAVPAGGSYAYLGAGHDGPAEPEPERRRGAGDRRCRPRAVGAAWRGEAGGPDADRGRDIARRLGAGRMSWAA